MDKIFITPAIKQIDIKCLIPPDVNEELYSKFYESSPTFSAGKKWAAEFNHGRASPTIGVQGANQPLRPRIYSFLSTRSADLKIRAFAVIENILAYRVHNILHEYFVLFARGPARLFRTLMIQISSHTYHKRTSRIIIIC